MTPQELAETLEQVRYRLLRGPGWESLRPSERTTRVTIGAQALEEAGVFRWIGTLQEAAAKSQELTEALAEAQERARAADRSAALATAERDRLASELAAAELRATSSRDEAAAVAVRLEGAEQRAAAELERERAAAADHLAAALDVMAAEHRDEVDRLTAEHQDTVDRLVAHHTADLASARAAGVDELKALQREVAAMRAHVLALQERGAGVTPGERALVPAMVGAPEAPPHDGPPTPRGASASAGRTGRGDAGPARVEVEDALADVETVTVDVAAALAEAEATRVVAEPGSPGPGGASARPRRSPSRLLRSSR